MPDLSVVIATLGGDVRPAVDAVASSAARARADVEVIVVGHGHRPTSTLGTVVEVLPLGIGYARNRGLALASAPLVAFLDDDVVVEAAWVEAALAAFEGGQLDALAGPLAGGPLALRWPQLRGRRLPFLSPLWLSGAANAAFRRSSLVDVHGFEHELRPAEADERARPEIFVRLARAGKTVSWSPSLAAAAARGRRRPPRPRREAGADAARRLATVAAERMPPAIREAFEAAPAPFTLSHPAKTHFSYLGAPGRILHLYANPSERLRRSLRDREAIRRLAGVGGIPRLLAVAESADAVWVVEERMPGRPPPAGAPERWFAAAADWAVGMAGTPGRPIGDVPAWNEHCEAMLTAAVALRRARIAAALEVASTLPAVHMHGDLQRRNVLLDGASVSAVDWEGAWIEGLPGLDLVFLALFAAGPRPDWSLLDRLAAGGDAPWGGLRARLLRLGVDDERLPDLLLSMLALWALSEDRRRSRLGGPAGPPVFGPQRDRFAADVAPSPTRRRR